MDELSDITVIVLNDLLTYIYFVAEMATSLSLTPFLDTYELKGYTLVKVSCVICIGSVTFKVNELWKGCLCV